MATLEYIKHDVTKTLRGVIAHGCNCQGVMGSGVAKALRDKWPMIFPRYRAMVDAHSGNKSVLLGRSVLVNVGADDPLIEINSLFVANLFTQEYYGADGRVYASVAAIEEALDETMRFCWAAELPLYMPRIGCGLGGLDWDTQVGPVVEQLVAKNHVDVFVCDL